MSGLPRFRVSLVMGLVAVAAVLLAETQVCAQVGRFRGRSRGATTARRSANAPGPASSTTPPGNGTIRRYRGESTGLFSRPIPPSGLNIGNLTVDQVQDGLFMPGFGVNNGFPAPERVYGGLYIPGFGVNNGFARPIPVRGGSYLPGFGVFNNGTAANGAAPASRGAIATPVHSGTYIPGFGVVNGRK
ncbi:MAG: hypothetical protein IRY99_06140 [Isosphaeraceae bacterium]|nr:hypothetical protein [Isosphaeraceae bacterium]